MWPLSRQPAATRKRGGRARPIRWRRTLRLGAAAALLLALLGGGYVLVVDGHVARAGNALIGLGGKLVAGAGLTVETVYVTGRKRTTADELVAALELRRGDPILRFQPDEARARLLELPWVQVATVARKLPQTIEIRIVEHEPLALWLDGRTKRLIDRAGAVIGIRDLKPWAEMPVVVGEDAPAHAAALLDVLQAYPQLYRQVRQARRVGGRRWDVQLNDGITVQLPEDGMATAWRQLAGLAAAEGLFDRDIVLVDLRLPDRLVVRLSPDAAARRRDPGQRT